MTNIRVVDTTMTTVTDYADPDDRWDQNNLYHSHCIEGIEIVGENDYHDLVVNFDPTKTPCYLLYVLYATGNSFHREEGEIEFIGVFQNLNIAKENKRIIETKRYRDSNEYYIHLLNEEGEEYQISPPWYGHFERLESVHIEMVEILDY